MDMMLACTDGATGQGPQNESTLLSIPCACAPHTTAERCVLPLPRTAPALTSLVTHYGWIVSRCPPR